jgi:hypothetical protein
MFMSEFIYRIGFGMLSIDLDREHKTYNGS